MRVSILSIFALLLIGMGLCGAEEVASAIAPVIDSGNTAWMLVASALVLFMTLPGLALFYGGLVRSKNVLSILMACFGSAGLVSVLWVIYGYSLAFDTTGMEGGVTTLASFIGGGKHLFLNGITPDTVLAGQTFPATIFVMFQLTFAIITPALIVGAFAERMKFWAMMLFTGLWFTVVYLPICHMAWSGPGALYWDWGVLDFAGGTVVHINAGIAGLVAAIMIGKRVGYPQTPMKPHNLVLAAIGAGMLWIGWFGFNAGSALAADGKAGAAMLSTHLATAAALLAWIVCEQIRHGKPSLLGAISGAVAGLIAITPAADVAGPMGALLMGAVAGAVCFFGVTTLKKWGGYDDALDAFGVHGVGGIAGALMTAVVASAALGGTKGGDYSVLTQLWVQTKAVLITIVWSGVATAVVLKAIDLTMGLRVTPEVENRGLDLSLHGEDAYHST